MRRGGGSTQRITIVVEVKCSRQPTKLQFSQATSCVPDYDSAGREETRSLGSSVIQSANKCDAHSLARMMNC